MIIHDKSCRESLTIVWSMIVIKFFYVSYKLYRNPPVRKILIIESKWLRKPIEVLKLDHIYLKNIVLSVSSAQNLK